MLAARYDAARADYERVLRQRNALLRARRPRRRRRARRSTCSTSSSCAPAPSWCGAGCGSSSGWARASPTRYAALAGGAEPSCAQRTRPSGRRAARRRRRRRRSTTRLARRARRRAAGRDRPGGHARRPAPRRVAARRSTGSTRARRRRRASSARSRSRCASRATRSCTELTGARAGAAARRRVQRARRAPRRSALVRNLPAGQTLVTTAGVAARRTSSPSGVCASHAGRDRGRRVTRATSREPSDPDEPVPLRRRARGASAASSACPSPTRSRRSPRLWPEIVGRGARGAHARCARCATACARSRSTARRGRPSCGTSNAGSSSGPRALLGRRCRDLGAGRRDTVRTATAASASEGRLTGGPSGTLARPETPPLTRTFALAGTGSSQHR